MGNSHEIRTVRCASCGALYGEASHWFVVVIARGRFRCGPLLGEAKTKGGEHTGVVLRRLRKAEHPVCGQQCAQKIFEKFLAQEGTRRFQTWPGHRVVGSRIAV